ncbi:MAG: HAD family hydrolase [Candidatus Latescibacteria bacterium]|jgi:putative hydrolase of the HAD superfamily|nr:HAD family hydrolase [Candidatus Latescibacterota bacterium]
MPIRGVLFDLDETLLDRQSAVSILAEQFADLHGGDLGDADEDDLIRVFLDADEGGYRPKDEMLARLIAELPWEREPELQDFLDFWQTTFPRCAQPMPGLYEVLEALRDREMRMGIVTNGPVAMQNGKIDRLDIRIYFGTIVVSEAVGISKPDPGIFEVALADLGLPACEVCFVGDSPTNDIQGAEASGLTPVWIPGTQSWPEGLAPTQHQINALGDLIPLLDGMS